MDCQGINYLEVMITAITLGVLALMGLIIGLIKYAKRDGTNEEVIRRNIDMINAEREHHERMREIERNRPVTDRDVSDRL